VVHTYKSSNSKVVSEERVDRESESHFGMRLWRKYHDVFPRRWRGSRHQTLDAEDIHKSRRLTTVLVSQSTATWRIEFTILW